MKRDIDKIVRDWFSKREKSDEYLAAMAQRISEQALRKRTGIAKGQRVSFNPLWFRVACAAGFALLFCATLFIFSSKDFPCAAPEHGESMLESSVDITRNQAKAGRAVFDEMERLFSDQFRWAAYSNGGSKLGIENLPGGVADDSVPVKYRLAVFVRQTGESGWRASFEKDVLLRSEELAAIACGNNGDSELNLWVMPVDYGKVMVDAAFSIDTPVRITASASCLLDCGHPVEILSGQQGDVEYRVFQSVILLENLS